MNSKFEGYEDGLNNRDRKPKDKSDEEVRSYCEGYHAGRNRRWHESCIASQNGFYDYEA